MAEHNPFSCLLTSLPRKNPWAVRLSDISGDEVPERNPYCKFYDRCLDIAARENKCFCCTGCRHFKEQDERVVLSSIELLNIHNLWREVFKSE